jgi:hypothetical protein
MIHASKVVVARGRWATAQQVRPHRILVVEQMNLLLPGVIQILKGPDGFARATPSTNSVGPLRGGAAMAVLAHATSVYGLRPGPPSGSTYSAAAAYALRAWTVGHKQTQK